MGFADRYALRKTSALISAANVVPRLTATTRYRVLVEIRNGRGQMEAPDSDTIYLRLVQPDGTELASRLYSLVSGGSILSDSGASGDIDHATNFFLQQTTSLSTGRFEAFLEVQSADTEQALSLEVAWQEAGVTNFTSKRITIGETSSEATSEITDAVLDEALASHTTAGTVGKAISDIDTAVAALPNAAANADQVWDEALSGHTTVGSAGKSLADVETSVGDPSGDTLTTLTAKIGNSASSLVSLLGTIDTVVDGIVTDVGDPSGDTLTDLTAKLGDSGDLSTTDSVLGLLGQPTDAVVSAPDGAEGSLFGKIRDISSDLAIVDTIVDTIVIDTNEIVSDVNGLVIDVGDASADTLGSLTAKLGDSGDLSTTNSVLGLLGQPTDAAIEATDGTEGSMFGKLRDIANDIAAIPTGSAPTAEANADAVWDEAAAGHTTAGTFGKHVADTISEIQNGTYGLSALDTDLGTILTAVQAVQNNTRFTAAVREVLVVPSAGTDPVEMLANLYDTAGNMEDPDDAEIMVRIRQTDGTFISNRLYEDVAFATPLATATDTTTFPGCTVNYTGIASGPFVVGNIVTGSSSGATGEIESDTGSVLTLIDVSGEFTGADVLTSGATTASFVSTTDAGWKAMKRDGIGRFSMFYKSSAADALEHVVFEFGWEETAVAIYQSRPAEVSNFASSADAVWDEALGGHTTAGTAGKALADVETNVGDASGDTLTSVVAKVGDSGDASTTNNVLGLLGDPTDAAVAADDGTEGSMFAKLRDISTDVNAVPTSAANADAIWDEAIAGHVAAGSFGETVGALGDWTANTNLTTLKAWLGELFETGGVPLADAFGMNLYTTASSGAGTFVLTQLTGGAVPTSSDDALNGLSFIPLTGSRKGESIRITDYVGATKTVSHAGATVGDSTTVALFGHKIGESDDTAASSIGATGFTVQAVLRLLMSSLIGDTTGDTLATLKAKLGDSGDASTTNSALGLLGDPTDASVESSDGTEGSMFGKIRNIGTDVNTAVTNVGDASGDTLTSIVAKVGDSGDASTTNNVLGLLGDPTDAAVAADDGTEGSMFGKIRDLSNDIAAISTSSGVRRATFKEYLIASTALLASDPTIAAENVAQTTQSTTYTALFQKQISLPAGASASVEDIFTTLHWQSQMTNGGGPGTGDTQWYISASAQTIDGSAALSGTTAISSEQAETTTQTEHSVSGRVIDSGIPATNGYYLILAGKVDNVLDTLDVDVYTDADAETTYSV